MKRTLALASLLLVAVLPACSDSQSGGDSNPDNQVTQPPIPSEDG